MKTLALHTPFSPMHLARLRRLGLDAIQLRIGPGYPVSTDDDELAEARAAAELLRREGVRVVSLGFYRNMMEPATDGTWVESDRLRRVFRMASLFDTDVVGVFAGRDPLRTIEDQIEDLAAVWRPLMAEAESLGLRVAFENCTMFRGWPMRGINATHTPAAYRLLFEALDSPAAGVELDPSHLLKQRIDIDHFVAEFGPRTWHVHLKDHERLDDMEYEHGCLDLRASRDRFPGRGRIDFAALLRSLHAAGYTGALTIEGERDPDYTTEEEIEAGLARSIAFLRGVLG